MRKKSIIFHVVLACFFLPIGIMFLTTGFLYMCGVRGTQTEVTRDVVLTEPLPAELSGLVAIAERELAAASVSTPSGAASMRKPGELEWSGVNRDVSLKAGADPLKAQLTIRDSSAFRRLMALHKAKGSVLAKCISLAWALGLLMLFISGVIIAWAAPPYRKVGLISGVAGIATFLVYVIIG